MRQVVVDGFSAEGVGTCGDAVLGFVEQDVEQEREGLEGELVDPDSVFEGADSGIPGSLLVVDEDLSGLDPGFHGSSAAQSAQSEVSVNAEGLGLPPVEALFWAELFSV